MCAGERVMLRKTVSVDEQLLQVGGGEQPHLRLLRRLERGHKKACSVQVSTRLRMVTLLFTRISSSWAAFTDFWYHTWVCYSSLRMSRSSPRGQRSSRDFYLTGQISFAALEDWIKLLSVTILLLTLAANVSDKVVLKLLLVNDQSVTSLLYDAAI